MVDSAPRDAFLHWVTMPKHRKQPLLNLWYYCCKKMSQLVTNFGFQILSKRFLPVTFKLCKSSRSVCGNVWAQMLGIFRWHHKNNISCCSKRLYEKEPSPFAGPNGGLTMWMDGTQNSKPSIYAFDLDETGGLFSLAERVQARARHILCNSGILWGVGRSLLNTWWVTLNNCWIGHILMFLI